MSKSDTNPSLSASNQSSGLTEKQCRELYAKGEVPFIGLDESGRKIWFLTSSGVKGTVVDDEGNTKLYNDWFTASLTLGWIKQE